MMRKIAIVLLFVAVIAGKETSQYGFSNLGSVELFSVNAPHTIGAINFAQELFPIRRMTVFGNLWDIPLARYIAVVHNCQSSKTCDALGPARAELNTVDPTKKRRPLAIFRDLRIGPTNSRFELMTSGASLIPGANDTIDNSFIAIYRDPPSGLKICSKSQDQTAKLIAWGHVESNLMAPGEPKIPDRIFD